MHHGAARVLEVIPPHGAIRASRPPGGPGWIPAPPVRKAGTLRPVPVPATAHPVPVPATARPVPGTGRIRGFIGVRPGWPERAVERGLWPYRPTCVRAGPFLLGILATVLDRDDAGLDRSRPAKSRDLLPVGEVALLRQQAVEPLGHLGHLLGLDVGDATCEIIR